MAINKDDQAKDELTFLVTTKANHNIASVKHIQIAEARSHTATRQHALKRGPYQEAIPISGGKELVLSLGDTEIISSKITSPSKTLAGEEDLQDNPVLTVQNRRHPSLPVRKVRHTNVLISSESNSGTSSTSLIRTHRTSIVASRSLHRSSRWRDPDVATISEIHSTLDPFIHLPLDITTEEKSLIHHHLLIGRKQVLGSAGASKYCPGLDIAQSIMQLCPMYSLGHIIIGEAISSRAAQRPVRPWYYLRCSQIYRQLNKLLIDPEVGIFRKMCALTQAAMVERVVNRPDLEALHTAALDDLVERQGSLTTSRLKEGDATFANVATRFYADAMIRKTIVIKSARRFATVKTRFMRCVRDICEWTLLPNHSMFDTSFQNTDEQTYVGKDLKWLPIYFDLLEFELLPPYAESTWSTRNKEALTSALSLIMTFVECNLHVAAARSFLTLVEAYIWGGLPSPATSSDTSSLAHVNQITIAHNISCARTESFPDPDYNREMKISQTMADAQAVLALLDPAAAAFITAWFVAIVKSVSSARFHGSHEELRALALSHDRTDSIALDIERGWKRQTENASSE